MANTPPYSAHLSRIRKQLDFSRSSGPLIRHFIEDFTLLSVAFAAYAHHSPWTYLISQLLFVVIFFRSFGLMHEAVHKNLSDNTKFNDFLGVLYGALCFLPFFNWRSIHLQHHLWAGNLDRDPTMRLVKSLPNAETSKLLKLNFVWKLWIPLLAVLQHFVFWKESIHKLKTAKKKTSYLWSLLPPSLVLIGIGLSPISGPFLGLWPAAAAYMLLVEIVNFPHHLGLPYRENNERLPYFEQYKVSRSCHYQPFLARFVFMNFNYHIEHHLFPNLPWHQLGKAKNLVFDCLKENNYNFDKGHDWIIRSRRKPILDVIKREEPQRRAA